MTPHTSTSRVENRYEVHAAVPARHWIPHLLLSLRFLLPLFSVVSIAVACLVGWYPTYSAGLSAVAGVAQTFELQVVQQIARAVEDRLDKLCPASFHPTPFYLVHFCHCVLAWDPWGRLGTPGLLRGEPWLAPHGSPQCYRAPRPAGCGPRVIGLFLAFHLSASFRLPSPSPVSDVPHC